VPQQAVPAKKAQVLAACLAAPERQAALLAMAWVTTGRPRCVSQLKLEDVQLQADGKMSVVFRRGKTVRLRQQPYAVHTVTGDFDRFIRPLVAAAEDPTKFLWYCDTGTTCWSQRQNA
jgi:hypothetical protein